MSMMQRLKNEIHSYVLKLQSRRLRKPSVQFEVPFCSQFASPEYAEKILKDGVPKHHDPNWKLSGAESSEHMHNGQMLRVAWLVLRWHLRFGKLRPRH